MLRKYFLKKRCSTPTLPMVARKSDHTTNKPISDRRIYMLLLLCWGVWGCTKDNQKIIVEKVTERVEEYKKKKREECRENLLAKAEKKVDSLLLAEAQLSLQDSLSKLRPFKPLQPPAIPAIDSSAVQPLFKGTPKQQ